LIVAEPPPLELELELEDPPDGELELELEEPHAAMMSDAPMATAIAVNGRFLKVISFNR
jgi:hypothetical protein